MLIFEKDLGKLSGYRVLLPAVSVGNAGWGLTYMTLANLNTCYYYDI